ncbi:MAG: UvrD-helicase domain-containing protein [Treponema sp.]|nr:UvrD-helicase domain-containing protein [Treponema sp.]
MAEDKLEQYLSVLNPQQRQAVVHEGSPLLILAGAGSGKTRVITTKIAYLIGNKNVNPYSILSVTFTKKAANEMRERAVAMEAQAAKAQIRTFHSFGSWFLRKYYEDAGVEQNFTVYDDEDMSILIRKAVPSLSQKESRLAAHQIALAKDYCLTPQDDLSFLASDFDIQDIYAKYEARLRSTGNVDFGDLIMMPVTVMENSPLIASDIHSRFNVIMVDEYQDSNIAQYKLLQKLSGVKEGYNNYVCVVGDDDQSIYKFRGAEVQNILGFSKQFPGTQIIRLERNYRSTSKILDAAGIVVGKNQDRLGKTLVADRGEGKMPVLAYVPDQNAEVTFCSELITKAVAAGGKYSDWAILYRTNAQSLGFEKDFLHRHIPYVVVGSLKFYEREEIKDTLAYLALCANPRDEISFRRIVNKPSRGLGDKTQDKILEKAVINNADGTTSYTSLLQACRDCAPELSKKAGEGAQAFLKIYDELVASFNKSKKLSDFIELVIKKSGLDEYHQASDEIEGTQRVANLQELINSAVPYECSVDGLTAFLDAINLDRTLELQNEEADGEAVTLITLHNTKGLEYNRVVITGLEQGVFPREDKLGADLEEERRLFYVGITRARDELYVTSTAQRILYGSLRMMSPSIFIQESEEAFKVIGRKPSAFGYGGFGGYGGYGGHTAYGGYGSSTRSGYTGKWAAGTKLYHDDYGYGVVTKAYYNEGELVIEVQFESGGNKKFLPEYQSKALQIIKD